MQTDPDLYVDADACPVKPEAVKVAERHGLGVTFVANGWMELPRVPTVRAAKRLRASSAPPAPVNSSSMAP